MDRLGFCYASFFGVRESGGSISKTRKIGEPSFGFSLSPSATTFTGLKQNTPHVAVLYTTAGGGSSSNPISRICFRTAADLEIPFGSGRGGDGPGDSWSSGCYAFSKDRNQILACFCGARNSSGQWAWTDSEDGYEYMMDAAWRNRVGCTTN